MYAIAVYRKNFAIKTKIKNFHQLYFKIPATKVIGSPMMGVQDNSKDTNPYFLKNLVAFWIELGLKYDFLIANSLRYFPKR